MNSDFKIILADPSPIILRGLSDIISEIAGYQVVLHSSDVLVVASRIHLLNPDVLIVNPTMIDYPKRLKIRELFSDFPDMKLVALVSAYFDEQVLKQYDGIIEINDNEHRVKSTLNQTVSLNKNHNVDNDSSVLSEREKSVLVGLAKGLMNKEIAEQLNLSVHTVMTHRKNIIRKTGIKSVSALTVYAILNNFIDQKDVI